MRVGRTTVTYRTAEQEARNQKCVQTVLYILAAIFMIAVPIGLYEVEHIKKTASEAFYEIEPQVVPGASNEKSLPGFAGHVVHVTGTPNPTELCDNDFGVCSNTFLRVQRNVEYCQWSEHYTEHKDRDNDGNTVTTRQYYYTLGWHSSPVSSLFFNQPFAHNNPQRNPFPSAGAVAASATVGPYTVPSTILARIDADRLLEPTRDQLRDFRESPAAREFQYIGRGYFYSPYQASTMSKIAQFAGRALEGSLDIQLGDFLKTCEAGDIRVHFKVADPQYVTVVAQQQGVNGMLNDAIASNGYHVGLIRSGLMSPSALFHFEVARLGWRVVALRCVAVAWGLVSLLVLRSVFPGLTTLHWAQYILGSLLMGAALSALGYILVWGATSWSALFLCLGSLAALPAWAFTSGALATVPKVAAM